MLPPLAENYPLYGAAAFVALLALVGLWYVIAHHLASILITALTLLGVTAGVDVLRRGWSFDFPDLIVIGIFLVIAFPVFFYQSVLMRKRGAPPPPAAVAQYKPDAARPAR